MEKLTQKEAVYITISSIIDLKKGEATALTDDQLKKISDSLFKGFKEKKVPFKPTKSNEARLADSRLLQIYIRGLIPNWIKKDKRLKGLTRATPAKKARKQ